MDAAYRQMRNEALLMLQLARLRRETPQLVAVLEASAISGEGVQTLLRHLVSVRIKDNV